LGTLPTPRVSAATGGCGEEGRGRPVRLMVQLGPYPCCGVHHPLAAYAVQLPPGAGPRCPSPLPGGGATNSPKEGALGCDEENTVGSDDDRP